MGKSKTRKPRSNAAAYKRMALEEKMLKNAYYSDLTKVYNEGMNKGYGAAILVMFWLLHTEHGFGTKRLALLLRKATDFCNEVLGPGPDGNLKTKEGEFDGISMKDIADQLAEECGVHIDTEKWLMQFDNIEIRKIESVEEAE